MVEQLHRTTSLLVQFEYELPCSTFPMMRLPMINCSAEILFTKLRLNIMSANLEASSITMLSKKLPSESL